MDYELALELKKAGFPLTPASVEEQTSYINAGYKNPAYAVIENVLFCIPTLDELIEALGSNIDFSLNEASKNLWCASCYSGDWTDDNRRMRSAPTPIEAVAKLYLALYAHKKD